MRIAYLSRGDSVYDHRFLEKMIERGHEPHFISYNARQPVNVQGAKNYFFNYNTMHRIRYLVMFQTGCHLRKLLRIIKPDILHTGWVPDHGFIGAVSGFHPALSMPWGSDVLIRPYDSFWAMLKTRITLRRADMITCDAQSVKDQIIKLSGCSPKKIIVFPWGIDLKNFYPKDSGKLRKKLGWEYKKVLICTRNFDIRAHGVEYFIRVLPAILNRHPVVRVILVGAGRLEQEYRKLVSSLGLDDVVHFAGWVNEIQMAEYLNASDIYVSTSLSDGTSCSLLEAMACGLPVVVSDVPANLEWVKDGDNGYIVPRKDKNQLIEAFIALSNDIQLQERMGGHNLQIARERADWDKNFSKLEDVYNRLVAAY